MKRINTKIGMVAVMLLAFLTTSAYDFEVDGFYYNVVYLDDMTCEITYANEDYNSYEGDIVIPSKVEYKGRTLSVSRIGHEAFYLCENLTSINIPSTITEIGVSAFKGCKNLESIDLPVSISSIGSDAFYNCSKLNGFEIPSKVHFLAPRILVGCTNIKEIKIPSNILGIDENAFGSSGIERLIIEDSDQPIELAGTYIDYPTFYKSSFGVSKNSKIKYVYLGREYTVQKANDHRHSPFLGIETIEEVVIGSNVTKLQFYTFVTLASKPTNSKYEFATLPNLTKLTILDAKSELKFIGGGWGLPVDGYSNDDIIDYKNVKNLCIERNIDYSILTHKDRSLFREICDAQISGSFTKLNSYFFYNCESLEKIDLSENLEYIGGNAFKNTPNINSIICRAEVPPTISESVGFSNDCYLNTPVLVPLTSLTSYQEADIWKNFWNLQGFTEASVGEIKYDKREVARYDLNGRVINKGYNGIVIIRYSDGTIRKIIQNP